MRNTRNTIDAEGDMFRINWRPKFDGYYECHPCGLFKTIEDARKSMPTLRPVPPSKRLFPASLEEYW